VPTSNKIKLTKQRFMASPPVMTDSS